LGIETMGGVFTKLIDANTTIPTKKSEVFSTASDNQPSVDIHVLQGERAMSADNKTLGRFQLTDIPPTPRGVPQIEVTFDVDANGILNVNAAEKSTGKSHKITITNDKGRLSKADVERMVEEAEKFAAEDAARAAKITARNELEAYFYNVRNSMREDKVKEKLGEDDISKTEDVVKEGLEWLEGHQDEEVETYKDYQKKAEEKVMPIMMKLYQGSGDAAGAPSSGPRVEEVD